MKSKQRIILVAFGIAPLAALACASKYSKADADSIAHSLAAAATAESRGNADMGKVLFKQLNCGTCHSTNGDNGLGPTLKGYFGSEVQYKDGSSERVDEDHARREIIDPNKRVMDGYGPTMPAIDWQKAPRKLSDVDDLVAFIKSLQ